MTIVLTKARALAARLKSRIFRESIRQDQKLQGLTQKLRVKEQENAELLTRLEDARSHKAGVNPQNIIWVFGSGRSGSTWLSSMMGEIAGFEEWREPLVGSLLGNFYYGRASHRIERPGRNFIFAERYKTTWLASIRSLILDAANVRYPNITPEEYLVIKEPNGSVGAPLIMEAIPASRMIFLVRDPRDVVTSIMAAREKGSWLDQQHDAQLGSRNPAVKDQDAYNTRLRAGTYMRHVRNSKGAYQTHAGRKALVRYEDLRADTLNTMQRIYSELEIQVSGAEIAQAVDKHAWENIPEHSKGEGKFYRKASPGG